MKSCSWMYNVDIFDMMMPMIAIFVRSSSLLFVKKLFSLSILYFSMYLITEGFKIQNFVIGREHTDTIFSVYSFQYISVGRIIEVSKTMTMNEIIYQI